MMHHIRTSLYFNNGLKAKLPFSLLQYYLWHVYRSKYDTIGQMIPKYGSHLSVTLPNIHGDRTVEQSKVYSGLDVDLFYTGFIEIGGRKLINGKQHRNFYLKFESDDLDKIKEELKIKEKNFLGFHLTICNNKNMLKTKN